MGGKAYPYPPHVGDWDNLSATKSNNCVGAYVWGLTACYPLYVAGA